MEDLFVDVQLQIWAAEGLFSVKNTYIIIHKGYVPIRPCFMYSVVINSLYLNK